MAFIRGKQSSVGSFVKGKQGSVGSFGKDSPKTGNIQEMTWYDDNTFATVVTWDLDVVSSGHEMIWDKNNNSMWVKVKQG